MPKGRNGQTLLPAATPADGFGARSRSRLQTPAPAMKK
jgi:hypothetical protein